MYNTMRLVYQISLVPEYVALRLESLCFASLCKALKGLFITPHCAGRKPSVIHLRLLEK